MHFVSFSSASSSYDDDELSGYSHEINEEIQMSPLETKDSLLAAERSKAMNELSRTIAPKFITKLNAQKEGKFTSFFEQKVDRRISQNMEIDLIHSKDQGASNNPSTISLDEETMEKNSNLELSFEQDINGSVYEVDASISCQWLKKVQYEFPSPESIMRDKITTGKKSNSTDHLVADDPFPGFQLSIDPPTLLHIVKRKRSESREAGRRLEIERSVGPLAGKVMLPVIKSGDDSINGLYTTVLPSKGLMRLAEREKRMTKGSEVERRGTR